MAAIRAHARAGLAALAYPPLVAVLAVAVLVRIAAAVAYEPALFYSDSWAYLSLAYGDSRFAIDRPSGYAAALWLLALPGRSLAVVTATQHLAGLATGALAYLALVRLDVPRALAAGAAAVVLLDGYAIALEQTVLAEAFTTLALVLAACLALVRRDSALLVGLGGVALGIAGTLRTAALFAVPVWVLYVLLTRRSASVRALAVCGVALPVLAMAGARDAATGRFALSSGSGWFMYGRVAEIADCGKFTPPKGTRMLCERGGPKRGAGPGYYLWTSRSPANRAFGGFSAAAAASPLPGRFAKAAIRQRPVAYAGIVARDTLQYFVPAVGSGGSSDAAIQMPGVPRASPPHFNVAARDRWVPGYEPPAGAAAGVLHRYAAIVHTPRPLLALLVLAALAAWLLGLRTRVRHAAEIFLFTGMGLAMLVGATATSAYIVRYLVPTVPLLVSGGALAVAGLPPVGARARAARAHPATRRMVS